MAKNPQMIILLLYTKVNENHQLGPEFLFYITQTPKIKLIIDRAVSVKNESMYSINSYVPHKHRFRFYNKIVEIYFQTENSELRFP
jgi:hypothetical protein